MVNLSHRSDQDSQRGKADQGQGFALGLDLGYGPDARPVTGGTFEEQRHRESYTRKEGQNDAALDQDDTPGEAQAADQDDAVVRDGVHPVRDESEMSSDDLQVLEQLRQRDAEVRAHEQAHVAAGGRHVTAGASYVYETGPDGRQYAVGGEVSIDTSPVPGNPEQTEQKARTVRRAALAPANPSAQDIKVATSAAQMEAEARMERIRQEQGEHGAEPENNRPSLSLGQDQSASVQTGFFSPPPDSSFPSAFPATSPAHRTPSIQAYRNQLALTANWNPL